MAKNMQVEMEKIMVYKGFEASYQEEEKTPEEQQWQKDWDNWDVPHSWRAH